VRRLGASLVSFGACCLLFAVAGAAAASGSTGRAVALGRTVGAPVTVAADPVGLSVEYQVLAADFGAGACPPPALVSAIEGLGVPALRIGGDSQDQTAPYGAPPLTGVSDLPAAFWSQLACLESQTHQPVVVGLNLASEMPAWAATMAAGARSAVPAALLSFEIGNEADIDGPAVAWSNAGPQARSLIPFQTYLDTAEAIAGQLGAGADIEGPDFATGRWISDIPQLVSALGLSTIDTHFYPLNACTGAAQATIPALLSRGASSLSRSVLATQAQAERAQRTMVISESNSVACRGKAGVSNSPAAAVWALRLVLNAVRGGIQSVRFHSSGSSYDPFVVSAGAVTMRPLYYGLQTAQRLLPLGASVTSLQTPRSLMAVLVRDPGGRLAYVVTNYGRGSRTVTVRSPVGASLLTVSNTRQVVSTAGVRSFHGALTVHVAPATVVAIELGA